MNTDPYPRAYRRTLHRDALRAAAVFADFGAVLFTMSAAITGWRLLFGDSPEVGVDVLAVLIAGWLVAGLLRVASWLRDAERTDRAKDPPL